MGKTTKQTVQSRTSYKFKNCYDIFFKSAMYDIENSNAINIHTAFKLETANDHNCIGCNVDEAAKSIHKFLSKHASKTEMNYDIPMYILTLYLAVERIEVILNIMGVNQKYLDKHFKVFQRIRRWANFVKHPKYFMLTHHPQYNFVNSQIVNDFNADLTINETFIDNYYKNNDKNDELYKVILGKKIVLVEYPDIKKITKDFCYSFNKFIDTIVKNEIYVELLTDMATFKGFFSNIDK